MSLFLKQFSTHSEYEQYINGSDAILPNVSICTTEGDVHYNPWVDPCASKIVKTTYEWVEIGGVKWATKNVGALTITDYGQKFSWGGVNGYTNEQVTGNCHSKAFSWADYEYGKSESNITKYNSTDGKTVLEASDDAATVNMGSGWRMPTKDEYVALGNAVNTAWTVNYQGSGVNGLVCTDKTDSNKVLFFPAGGVCNNNTEKRLGGACYCWTSSLFTTGNRQYARCMYCIPNEGYVSWSGNDIRYCGMSVRGVLDE